MEVTDKRFYAGATLALLGLGLGVWQQTVLRKALHQSEARTDILADFTISTTLHAGATYRFSHDILNSVVTPACRDNCPPSVIKMWGEIGEKLDKTATAYKVGLRFDPAEVTNGSGSAHEASDLAQGQYARKKIEKFLKNAQPLLNGIAATQSPPSESLVLEAKKLALENEHLALENEKLRLDIADHPGPVRAFLESTKGTATWLLSIVVGVSPFISSLRKTMRARKRQNASQ